VRQRDRERQRETETDRDRERERERERKGKKCSTRPLRLRTGEGDETSLGNAQDVVFIVKVSTPLCPFGIAYRMVLCLFGVACRMVICPFGIACCMVLCLRHCLPYGCPISLWHCPPCGHPMSLWHCLPCGPVEYHAWAQESRQRPGRRLHRQGLILLMTDRESVWVGVGVGVGVRKGRRLRRQGFILLISRRATLRVMKKKSRRRWDSKFHPSDPLCP